MYEIEKMTNHFIPVEITGFINSVSTYEIEIEHITERAINIAIDDVSYYQEQRDLFDYDIIPISCVDEDFICLFFNKEKIQIIYWSSERATIDKELGIISLYDNINDFLLNCNVVELKS